MDKTLKTKQSILIKIIIYFFLIIIIFTILSRAANSLTIPMVTVGNPMKGSLEIKINGNGTVAEAAKKYIKIHEDLTIGEVKVQEGQKVKTGDPIFSYDLEDLNKKQKDLQDDLKKLDIQLRKEKLFVPKDISNAETSSAKLALQQANLALQAAKETLTKEEEYIDEEEINSAKENVEMMEIALEQAKLAFEKAKKNDINTADNLERQNELSALQIDYINSAIDKKEDEIEEIKDVLSSDNTDTDDDSDEYREKLKNARNELEQLKLQLQQEEINSYNYEIFEETESAEIDLKKAELNLEYAKDSLEKAKVYKNDQKIESAKENLKAQERSVQQAQIKLDEAVLNDKNNNLNSKNEAEKSKLAIDSLQLDINNTGDEINQLQELINSSGIINSPLDGTIITIDVKANQRATGAETICIGTDGYIFKAIIPKDQGESIKAYDDLYIKLLGSDDEINIKVDSVRIINTDNTVEIKAKLPENEYDFGAGCSFRIVKKLGDYENCIPISALREDNKGKFVLAARKTDSILGTELTAYRINVNLIKKGYDTAAVDGLLLQKDDKLIIESNKYISEGDKVRIDYE